MKDASEGLFHLDNHAQPQSFPENIFEFSWSRETDMIFVMRLFGQLPRGVDAEVLKL